MKNFGAEEWLNEICFCSVQCSRIGGTKRGQSGGSGIGQVTEYESWHWVRVDRHAETGVALKKIIFGMD